MGKKINGYCGCGLCKGFIFFPNVAWRAGVVVETSWTEKSIFTLIVVYVINILYPKYGMAGMSVARLWTENLIVFAVVIYV